MGTDWWQKCGESERSANSEAVAMSQLAKTRDIRNLAKMKYSVIVKGFYEYLDDLFIVGTHGVPRRSTFDFLLTVNAIF